jgi:hypothetical protein
MTSVRAKFRVVALRSSMTAPKGPGPDIEIRTIELQPVVAGEGNAENDRFFHRTPSGRIELGVVAPAAAQLFEVGQEYYVDFSRAAPGLGRSELGHVGYHVPTNAELSAGAIPGPDRSATSGAGGKAEPAQDELLAGNTVDELPIDPAHSASKWVDPAPREGISIKSDGVQVTDNTIIGTGPQP